MTSSPPAHQDAYYRQHPNNVIRLILGKDPAAATTRRTTAIPARATCLPSGGTDGVLRLTARPSFWMYEQEFDLPDIGRRRMRGFIGAVRLRDYEERRILPHEKVIKGPLEDRIRLTETAGTQFEYIWSLYQDKAYVIDNILDAHERDAPIIDFEEKPVGVRHRLRRLTDPESCDIVRRTMARLRIYIADGHHRYQTMLTIRDRMRARFPGAGPDAPWEYIMMFLVNSEHEGLTILPTHRMLHGIQVESLYRLGAAILEHFHVKKYPFRDGDEPEVRRRWLRDLRSVRPGGAQVRGVHREHSWVLSPHPSRRGGIRGACAPGVLLPMEAAGREHPQHADSGADPGDHGGAAQPCHEHLLYQGRG